MRVFHIPLTYYWWNAKYHTTTGAMHIVLTLLYFVLHLHLLLLYVKLGNS